MRASQSKGNIPGYLAAISRDNNVINSGIIDSLVINEYFFDLDGRWRWIVCIDKATITAAAQINDQIKGKYIKQRSNT
jgi:hypothetical protein